MKNSKKQREYPWYLDLALAFLFIGMLGADAPPAITAIAFAFIAIAGVLVVIYNVQEYRREVRRAEFKARMDRIRGVDINSERRRVA